MTDQSFTREDLDKLLRLIQEYTEKLREACQAKQTARLRLNQAQLTLWLIGIVLASLSILALPSVLASKYSFLNAATTMIVAGGVVVATVLILSTSLNRSGRQTFDVDMLAASLERLVRTASQYNEHAARLISDKFELDLRLAEAEGVLRVYERLFRNRADLRDKNQ